MNTWIFYLTDSLRTTIAVAGTGTTRAAGEADARTKWAAFVAGRPEQRAPIIECIDSGINTEMDAYNMPGLLL